MKLKLVIEARGRTREELLSLALQAIANAVQKPGEAGLRITTGISLFAPDAWVNYKITKARPSRAKPVAIA